jgi:Leucine-rich repeat (LRR) protein
VNLNLSYNRINALESGSFSGLTNLRFLNLYSNDLVQLNLEVFSFFEMVNLMILNLSGNDFESVFTSEKVLFTKTRRRLIIKLGNLDGIEDLSVLDSLADKGFIKLIYDE